MREHLLFVFFITSILYGTQIQAQTTFINVPENGFNATNGWTISAAKLTTVSTQSILCGDNVTRDFKYLDCIVNNTFTLSRFSKNAGYLEFPEFPSIGEITIFANSTGKDYTLQKWDGAAWADVAVINVAATGLNTYNYTSGSAVKLRIITKNTGGDVGIRSLKIVGVASDPIPPAMVSSIPVQNAVDVSPAIDFISITFDKEIMKGSGDISVSDGVNSLTVSINDCTINGKVLSIPVSGLNVSKTYTVSLPAGFIENLSGTKTTSEITFSFSTKASLSSEAEITAINFGVRQIGSAVVNSNAATVDVTLMNGTSIKTSTQIASIKAPTVSVSAYADVTTLPTDFEISPEIVVTAEDGVTTKTWTVNFIQATIAPKTLPAAFLGTGTSSWTNSVETGYASNIINATTSQKINNVNWYPAQLSQANQFVTVHFDEPANLVSFRIRYGQINRAYEFKVQESADGTNWTDLAVYSYDRAYDNTNDPNPDVPNLNTTMGLRSYALSSTSKFVRWLYTDRTATTMYLDDILIENKVDNTAPKILSATNSTSNIILQMNEPVKISSFNSGIILNGGIFIDKEITENEIIITRDGDLVIMLSGLTTTDTYTLTIPQGAIKDLSNNDLPAQTINLVGGIYTSTPKISSLKPSFILMKNQLILDSNVNFAILFDSLGKKVSISTGNVVELSVLAPGVYIVHCKLDNGTIEKTKIIKK